MLSHSSFTDEQERWIMTEYRKLENPTLVKRKFKINPNFLQVYGFLRCPPTKAPWPVSLQSDIGEHDVGEGDGGD